MLKRPVHILGAGGIGVALAWCLLRDGNDVTLIDSNPGKINAGQKNGLTVDGHGTEHPPFIAFENWRPPQEALILLCSKTYDNAAIIQCLQTKSNLVPVQNGFDPELDQQNHAGEGIASFVSECERDNPLTRITRPGSLHIGARREVTTEERAEIIALGEALSHAGLFPVEQVEDVRPYKYAKLMYNAAISPLAAAAGIDNGELLIDPLAKKLFFGLLQENYAILKHANMPLATIGPFHPDTVSRILRVPGLATIMAMFFRPSLRGTYCSMAPDVGSGHTEMDAYNGHLIRLAGDYPCPLNRAAYDMVARVDKERLTPERGHLQTLADSLPAGALS